MPESIRAANERLRSRPWRGGFLAAFVFASLSSLLSTPVRAETRLGATLAGAVQRALATLRDQEVTALTLVLALLGVALLTTVVLFRLRRSADRVEFSARDEAATLRAEVDRLKALLLSEPQVLVTWPVAPEQPEIIGDTAMLAPGGPRERVLAFGTWLEGAAARRMEEAVDTLRNDGRGFAMAVTSRGGRPAWIARVSGRCTSMSGTIHTLLTIYNLGGYDPAYADPAAAVRRRRRDRGWRRGRRQRRVPPRRGGGAGRPARARPAGQRLDLEGGGRAARAVL